MARSRVPSEPDEDVYHVEVITSARVNDDAEWEYLVSWAGYPTDDDSWEPAENVEECDRLLRSFWKHVGMDDRDYSPGDQFDAQPWWIKREREHFANTWKDKTKKKKKSSRDKHYSFSVRGSGSKKVTTDKNKKKALQDFVQRENASQSDDDTDDSEDIPLSQSLASSPKKGALFAERHKGKKRQRNSDTDERSSTDDEWPRKGMHSDGVPGPSRVTGAQPKPKPGKKRRRPSSPISPLGDNVASSSEPPRKEARTSSVSQPSAFLTVPVTPTRGDARASNARDSPSSLFSAPSSPPPIPVVPSPQPPLQMAPPSVTNLTDSSSRPPPLKPTGSPKVIRKPRWLLQPKIKRFDAPNLKPSSTLPTKAILFERSRPSAPRKDSVQSLPEASARRSSVTVEGSNMDARHQSSVPQLTDVQSPTVQEDMPMLPPASLAEANAFLKEFMPPRMSEPMDDGVEMNRPYSAPTRKQSTVGLKNMSIPRKFKWTGELRINTSKDLKERVCNVILSETSEGSPRRLRFSMCFDPSKSFLLLEKLFSLDDLQCLRPALTPVAEIAKLGPENEADAQALNTLFLYMSSRKLVSCSAIDIDDNQVALLLVFPSTNNALFKEYHVRSELRKPGHFIAVLLPWKVVGIQALRHCLYRQPRDRNHPIFDAGQKESIVVAERERSLRRDPSYHRALSILGFPKWLDDEISTSDWAYCIWNKRGDGTPEEPGLETRALRHILDKRRAKDVGHKADVSVVFVHVGAIKTLSWLPAFMERRMKRVDIQFVTYGTHHTIPPARWGMRMIYPAGGIVTISPSVFSECPLSVYKLLDMLEQHPLWDCFVTPGVVALSARQNQGSDPVTEFEKGTLIHQDLLSRIERGQLSLLLTEPPPYGSEEGPILEWIRRHQGTTVLESRSILEDCLRGFSKEYSDYPEEKWTFRVLETLHSTVSSLQVQPCIMDQYRRFAVITGKQDKIAADWGGFEWITIDGFNFRDDYFSKDKMEDLRCWASVEQALSML